MIVYFADRHMNILGVASDLLPGAFHLRDDMKTSELENGVSTFEVTFDYKKDTHVTLKKYCAAGNFLLVKEKDGTYTPYTIIDKEDDISDRHIYVYVEDAGLDLLNEIVPAFELAPEVVDAGGETAANYILAFTADSGFEIGINEIAKNDDGTDKKRSLSWDSESTATERIRSVATEFDNAEIGYSFTIDKFRITHKYINLYKKHGKDVALELRFGREIDNIVEKESVANLVTALRCYGGTPEATDANPDPLPITLVGYRYDDGDIYTDGVFLKSREANKKWSRYLTESGTGEGYIVGSFDYDTTSQQELCNRAITELKKLREPEITYEVALNTLPENLKLGDTCRIIDDNGELYVSARLIELKVSECNNTREATFGDFKKLTSGINDKVEKLADEFAKIQAAKTLYTWMVFADDASGTNMSTSSAGKEYIGIATNKISPTPDLTNPLLYTFTRISAVDGRGFTVRGSWAPNTSYSITGTNIDVVEYEGSTYACNNSHVSGQTFDPSKWVLIAEKGTDGQDGHSPVVSATKTGGTTTIKVDGSTIATILDGTDGVDGHSPTITTSKSGDTTTIYADGVSIGTVTDGDDGHSPSVTATKSNGVTTVKVDGTTVATINDGSSVIIKSATKVGDTTTVVLQDASGTKTLTIKDGEDGDNGQPGSNGDDAYVHIAWATAADGSEGFSTSVSEGKTYMGSYSDHALADSQNPSSYNWSLIKGEDGHTPVISGSKSGNTTTIKSDGVTIATILDGEDGHSPTITTTKSGTTTTILADGVSIGTIIDGDDGHSPSVTATKTDGVTTVKVDGTTIATINDGSSVIIQSATKVGDTTTVILKDGSGTQTLTIKDGEDGDNGQPGSNGDDAYVHIAWATSADGSEGFSTSVSEGKTYMGSYSDHTLADSQTPSDYNWSLIKGEDGNGIVSKTDYYMLSDTMDLSELNTSKSYYKKAMSGKQVTVSDATNIASFDDIIVDVNYIQSGSGDPYLPGSTKNKFNPDTRTTGKYINGSGVISSDTNSSYSELIPVTVGTTYTYSGKSSSSGSNNKRVHGYASGVWQQQIAFESIAASTNFAITFTVPTGIDAIRISAYTSDTNIQLEEGSTATSYVAYSNIRPISGLTDAQVVRTGRNIFGGNLLRDGIKAAVPTASDHADIRAIDYAVTVPVYSSFTKAAGLDGKFKENTAYTFIVTLETTNSRSTNMRIYYTDGTHINVPNVSGINTKETKVVVTSPNKTVQNIYRIYSATSVTRVYYDESGLFEGVLTLSDFEQYIGETYPITWEDEAGTVYSGYIDLKAGTLTVTHGIKTFNGQESWGKSTANNPNGTAYTLADSNIPFKTWSSDAGGAICSHFKRSSIDGLASGDGFYWYKASSGGWRFVYGATGGTDTVDNFKNFLQTQYTNGTPVTICAELETPIVYNIQTPDISQLAGTNNIWANTGDISLSYYNEENPTWKTESLEPNPYGKYLWWYYNTTYTDGTSVDSDPALIGIYNQDWYEDTQRALADAESASQTANDAAKAAEANAGALRNISDIVNGTENTTGLVDQINSISNTMATASSVEELREEKNQDLERLISNYSLSDFLNWFHFDQNQGLIIGKTTTTGSANYVLRLEGDIISFYELTGNVSDLNDQQRVGYFQNRNLMSENIVALSTFDLGNFRFMKQDSGNLSFVYTG